MQSILKRINKIQGVRGTLIAGDDGLVIAADLSGTEDANALGAVASTVAASLSGALERLGQGQFDRFVMNGSQGSLALLAVNSAILLTLLQKDVNIGMVLVELKDAAAELENILGS